MKILLASILLIFSSASIAGGDDPDDMAVFIGQSKAQIKRLATSLKTKLTEAMQNGGPGKAIEVCNLEAPVITSDINSTSDVYVKRTSLKIRNPDNAPDEWEIMVLNKFQEQLDNGMPLKEINYAQVSEQDGVTTYRMMRPIPVGGVCLACHGPSDSLPKEVKQELKTKYPDDQATGYAAGQLRGAFSVTKTLPHQESS